MEVQKYLFLQPGRKRSESRPSVSRRPPRAEEPQPRFRRFRRESCKVTSPNTKYQIQQMLGFSFQI